MKVLKFGGTSVGTAERMRKVADLVNDSEPKIVVLSAMAGTTNHLIGIGENIKSGHAETALKQIDTLELQYSSLIQLLFKSQKYQLEAENMLTNHFEQMKSIAAEAYSRDNENILIAKGELISTQLFSLLLSEMKIQSVLISAIEIIRTDLGGEPDLNFTAQKLGEIIKSHPDTNLFVTQGFICKNFKDDTDNLGRGGSDYSATIIGSAVAAEEIQIWTDINGLQNNDPRIVNRTRCVEKLSFEEAAELAYFGAKILHPQSICPAEKAGIPVRLLNTLNPSDNGTLISGEPGTVTSVKAVAVKNGITAIKIKSGKMLMAYGFLRAVFEVFEKHKTPIDMITTSEVAVSLTIDNPENLNEILSELKSFGRIETDSGQAIICVVGNMIAEEKGTAEKIFSCLKDVPLRMISYGGSTHNISILVDEAEINKALNALNDSLFKF